MKITELANTVNQYSPHEFVEFLNECGRIMSVMEHSCNPNDWLETKINQVKVESLTELSDNARRFIQQLSDLLPKKEDSDTYELECRHDWRLSHCRTFVFCNRCGKNESLLEL